MDRMKSFSVCLLALAALLLSGCESTLQKYSAPEHQTFRLNGNDLSSGGLAFLTPSTVTGQEEDKQSLAHVFANTLKRERKDVRVLGLPETISAVNRAGLAGAYRAMYHDYRETAVLDGKVMGEIARAAGVRYLAQLKLANMQQGARGRFSLLGLSLLQTQFANMRVFFQIWDSRDGTIAWEGIDELTFAQDTGQERPISFRAVAEHAAQDLTRRLP
jgi:hypothetical protein